jgi:phosphomannomutase/phosphoglucomutase
MANLQPTMFREYDVRGLVNDQEINEASVEIIAKAYGTMLSKRGIQTAVVGHDLRKGSKELTQIAIKGLRSTGVKVIFIGQALTPMMYHAQYHFDTKGGMEVTASHNPNGWLGFKLALGLSYTLGPVEIKELRELTVSEAFATGEGGFEELDYLPIYSKDLVSRIKLGRPVRVLINAGNGTAGPIAPAILKAAGCEVFEFLTEPDLEFTHYFPNPSLEQMMIDTGQQTVQHGAEIGIAFDGDGDRLGVTDEQGQLSWPDRYMILMAREALAQVPGAPIVFDMKCSRALSEDIIAHGGKPTLWKTGHSYIKEKLHELDAPLAIEMSGHIFFGKPGYYGFDDAVYTALKVIEKLSHTDKSLSQLIAETPKYISTPTLQAACPDEIKYDIVAEMVEVFQKEGYEVIIFDNNPRLGCRIEFPDGWALVRASSNLPTLVMRFEATTDAKLAELQQMVRTKFEKYPQISQTWENG